MRIANLDGRLVIVTDAGVVDVEEASSQRFQADPKASTPSGTISASGRPAPTYPTRSPCSTPLFCDRPRLDRPSSLPSG